MNNKMQIALTVGVNADGCSISIINSSGELVFRKNYYYGGNASYSRIFADSSKPYIGDIVNELKVKYSITDKDIDYVVGKNVFNGKDVSQERIDQFKSLLTEYVVKKDDNSDWEVTDKYPDLVEDTDCSSFTIKKYGAWWWGILDDNELMIRDDYNKLKLFSSEEEAQNYINTILCK